MREGSGTSEGASSDPKLTVFVSYSRHDITFADRLVAALEARELRVLIDRRSLPALEDWERELLGLIREADTVVFIISPHSIRSRIVAWEVEQVCAHSKRLAPVVIADMQAMPVPAEIAKINYLFFIDDSLFETRADELAQALKTDIHWLKEHTRLSEFARRWLERDRAADLLLRGRDLDEAESWAMRRSQESPAIGELLSEFLRASRAFEAARLQKERDQISRARRLQRRSGWALAAIGLLVTGGLIAAVVQARSASKTDAKVFAALARRAFQAGNCVLGVRYALSGLPPFGSTPVAFRSQEVEDLLRKGVSTCPVLSSIKGRYNDALVLPGADKALFDGIEGDDRRRAIWTLNSRFVAALDPWKNPHGGLKVFEDASKISVVEEDNVLRVYSTQSGKVVARLDGVCGKSNDVDSIEDYTDVSLAVSGDGKYVAVGAPRKRIRILNVGTGHVDTQLGEEGQAAYAFSADDKLFVSGTRHAQEIQVWDWRNDEMVDHTLSTTEHRAAVFSPSGDRIAIWGFSGAELWQPGRGEAPVKFSKIAASYPVDQKEGMRAVVFDRLRNRAAFVGDSHTYIWDFAKGMLLMTIEHYSLTKVRFTPDGVYFLGGVGATRLDMEPFLGIWRITDGKLMGKIPTSGVVGSLELSADGSRVATGTGSSVAELWDLEWLRLPNDAEVLQQYVCDRGYLGARAYSPQELADPILRGRTTPDSPCDRRGPLAPEYWSRFFSSAFAMR